MNVTVLEIDFDTVVHTKENSRANEAILNEQRERLSNNCKILYEAMLKGERLTGPIVVKKYGMMEYRRRFKDLKDAGIEIKEEINSNGCKTWWIE